MDLAKLFFVDVMAFIVVAMPTLLVAMKIATRDRPVPAAVKRRAYGHPGPLKAREA